MTNAVGPSGANGSFRRPVTAPRNKPASSHENWSDAGLVGGLGKVYGFAPTVPFFSASAIGVTVGAAAPTSSNTELPLSAAQTLPEGSTAIPEPLVKPVCT